MLCRIFRPYVVIFRPIDWYHSLVPKIFFSGVIQDSGHVSLFFIISFSNIMIWNDLCHIRAVLQNCNFRCAVTENLMWFKNLEKGEGFSTFLGVKYEHPGANK